jgi:ribosome biogenesis GTPase
LPKVGDWVAISLFDENTKAVIHDVLPRRTKLSRKSADRKTKEQVIAANIDTVFIVQSLDENFNVNRLARYLVTVNQSGAKPVVILNKSDLCNTVTDKIYEVMKLDDRVKVFPVSATNNIGIEQLKESISKGETIAFVGSSGVGKSTLINVLLGIDKLKINPVRESDSRGKHTTTRRELIVLPNGGILIDTPGMRELGLWNADNGLSQTFSDFEEYASQCYFSDCTHTHEIKCAVLQALKDGAITQQQYDNYLKLRKELKYLERKQDKFAELEEKKKWKNIGKEIKRFYKNHKR